MNKPELLAPAGSMEALHAAVDNGADAVYLGVGTFNARANAQNFLLDDLREAVQYAHLRSVRVYLTINTLLHDEEIPEAVLLARTAYDEGVDALIVQDSGLVQRLQAECPWIPLHASTQMNLFDKDAVKWAADHHFSRIILPRELSAEEISERAKEAAGRGIEIEVFVHGALCVCYSGLCLFSAMNGNGARSGNRGLCAQPCRTRFSLLTNDGTEEKSGRLLSTKDQCGLPYLSQLMEAGVRSFKIEGRMKEPSYVAAAVRSYREFIDRVSAGEDPKEAESMVMNHLLLAFNRGGSFTTQYLQGKKKDNLPSGDYSGRYGLLSGFIVKKNARAGTLSIRLSSETIPIRGDYLSIRVNDREIASFPIGKAEKLGDVLIVQGLHPQMIEKVPDGALVFQMSETAYTRDLLQGKASRKTPVVIAVGEQIDGEKRSVRLHISVRDGMWRGVEASVSLPVAQDASYPELAQTRISEQLSKTKSSPFDAVSVVIDPSLALCAPVSFLNELRREGFAALEQQIFAQKHAEVLSEETMSAVRASASVFPAGDADGSIPSGDLIHVNYFDLRRILPQRLSVGADYYSFSVFDLMQDSVRDAVKILHTDEPGARFLIWLPGAYKDALSAVIGKTVLYMKHEYPDAFAGVVSSSPWITFRNTWVNASANLFNHEAFLAALHAGASAVSPSYELKDQHVQNILDAIPSEEFRSAYLSLHRYGRIEWMQSEFCPVGRHENGCRKCREKDNNYSLQILSQDDTEPAKGKILPIVTHSGFCMSEIIGQLHPSAGEGLLAACRQKHIHIAHTVRFLDESIDERLHITNEIRSGMNDLRYAYAK